MTASYKTTFYECGCDYKSIHAGNASWHKKKCSHEMKSGNREAGCMKTNTEMISNISLAREVFYEFIEM
jgi:hypothetical protein